MMECCHHALMRKPPCLNGYTINALYTAYYCVPIALLGRTHCTLRVRFQLHRCFHGLLCCHDTGAPWDAAIV